MASLWSHSATPTERVIQSFIRVLPLGLIAALLAWLSLGPRPHESGLADLMARFGGDLSSHAAAWCVLALAARWALDFGCAARGTKLVTWALCVGWGVFLEGLQSGIPGRGAQWVDLIGDGLGALVGVLLMGFWLKRRRGDGEA